MDLHLTVDKKLSAKWHRGYGVSRHKCKSDSQDTTSRIHSRATFETYSSNCHRFMSWIESNHSECNNIYQASNYIPDYLNKMKDEGLSAYSQKTMLSALNKLYEGTKIGDTIQDRMSRPDKYPDYQTDERHRADIVRSRELESVHMQAIERSPEVVQFIRDTGLRRSEMLNLRGDDYRKTETSIEVHVSQGKGGKERWVPVAPENAQNVLKAFENVPPEARVFDSIDKNMPCHALRSEYAMNLYNSVARPVDSLPSKDKYHCRKDLQGVVLDKQAMKHVSRALGHERVEVFASNYYRK